MPEALVAIYRAAHQGRDDSAALLPMLAQISSLSKLGIDDDRPGYFGWVGIVDQKPVGFILCRILWAQKPAMDTELVDIAVLPEYQGQSIGFQLLSKTLTDIKALSAYGYHEVQMFLEVAQPNLKAQRLYEKTGFWQTGLRKQYSQNPDGSRVDALSYLWRS